MSFTAESKYDEPHLPSFEEYQTVAVPPPPYYEASHAISLQEMEQKIRQKLEEEQRLYKELEEKIRREMKHAEIEAKLRVEAQLEETIRMRIKQEEEQKEEKRVAAEKEMEQKQAELQAFNRSKIPEIMEYFYKSMESLWKKVPLTQTDSAFLAYAKGHNDRNPLDEKKTIYALSKWLDTLSCPFIGVFNRMNFTHGQDYRMYMYSYLLTENGVYESYASMSTTCNATASTRYSHSEPRQIYAFHEPVKTNTIVGGMLLSYCSIPSLHRTTNVGCIHETHKSDNDGYERFLSLIHAIPGTKSK